MLHPIRVFPFLCILVSVALHAQTPPPTLPGPPVRLAVPATTTPASKPNGLPFFLQGRERGARETLSKTFGMKPAAEKAVVRALTWLKDHQNADGSWGEKNRAAMTGLALLAFLGHGEMPHSPEFGICVGKGVEWALKNGEAHAGRLHMDADFSRNTDVYEHSILTYALTEYYALSRDERVADLLRKALDFIVKGQGPGGGWMYCYDRSANDLSVSGWQIQALRIASVGGLHSPQIEAVLTKAGGYLDKVRGPQGGYGYRGPEDRYSLTGAGIFCRLLWKGGRQDVRRGVDFILLETAQNKPVKYRSEWADLYAWYYHTHALFAYGGQAWQKWRDGYQNELLAAQSADGTWPPPGGGGHGPEGLETLDGKIYRTALCTLMLEVAYRYQWPPLGI